VTLKETSGTVLAPPWYLRGTYTHQMNANWIADTRLDVNCPEYIGTAYSNYHAPYARPDVAVACRQDQ
jgi:hypothetical protein